MTDSELLLATKFSNNSPSVLLLGQNYYREYPNIVLEDTLKKYNLGTSDNYDALFAISSKVEACFHINTISRQLPITDDLERISSVLWSSVYTSSIDSFLDKMFESEWRTTTSILTDHENHVDLRNPNKLHINYLYGKASQVDADKLPPFSKFEKDRRNTVARNLLAKLPTILTTTGVLVIDGLSTNDWLTTQMLFEYISSLGTNQVFMFSATDELRSDDYLVELVRNNRLWISSQSLSDFLRENNISQSSSSNNDSTQNTHNKWIRIADKRINIPLDIWNAVVRSATVLDEHILSSPILSQDRLKEEFRNFLADSSSQPTWSGYARGFAFERSVYEDLKAKVIQKIYYNKRDEPIILHGQAVSGKTILLGKLAYEMFHKGVPVLYIDRNRRLPDNDDINDFCSWVETKNSSNPSTLVIWDGMQSINNYHNLVRAMQSRGRKVVVVGSCYKEKTSAKKSNFVEISIDLNNAEVTDLANLLEQYFGSLTSTLIKNLRYSNKIVDQKDAKNLLALLYRHINNIAPTRQGAETGIYSEAKFVTQNYFAKYLLEQNIKDEPSISDWQQQLIDVKLVTKEEIEKKNFGIGDDKYNLPEQLIYTVMSVARLGNLPIPIDIIIRLLGKEVFLSNLMKEIDKQDLLRWHTDDLGNITISARNEVEAQIILDKNGIDEAKRIDIYDQLLQQIKVYDTERNDIELDFAINLLVTIGPNGLNEKYKIDPRFYYKIATILAQLREKKPHLQLMFREAFLLREIVVFKTQKENYELPDGETELSLLNRAEAIVQEGLTTARKKTLANFRVELASIYSYKIKYEANKDKKNVYYNEVKKTVYTASLQNPDTYHALDVAVGATENVLENLSEQDRLEARVYFLDLFENAELEGIRPEGSERYRFNQQKVYGLLGESNLSEEAFKQLCQSGSKAGYYLKALEKLSTDVDKNKVSLIRQPLSERTKANVQSAFNYLDGNQKEIFSDLRCLNLYFRLWWLLHNRNPLFYKEDDVILFNEQQWKRCFELVCMIVGLNGVGEIPSSLFFIKGMCEFHSANFQQQKNTFMELATKTDYADTRRIKTWYFACEQQKIKEYSGTIEEDLNIRLKQKGQIFCEELSLYINFQLSDFNISKLNAGDKINFRIAFNFRGILAQPIK